MNHIPLRIDWELLQPWVPTAHGIHFDALIASVLVNRALAQPRLPEQLRTFEDVTRDLPFGRHEAGGRFVWMASLIVPEAIESSERQLMCPKTPVEAIAHWSDLGVIEGGRGKVDTQRGYFKAGFFYYPLQHVNKVSAWCVGDPDVLSDLLADVTNLGPKGRLGHGAVRRCADGLSFQMTEDPAALDAWRIRHMPEWHDGYFPLDGALTTPYWRKDRHDIVYAPMDPIGMAEPYRPTKPAAQAEKDEPGPAVEPAAAAIDTAAHDVAGEPAAAIVG